MTLKILLKKAKNGTRIAKTAIEAFLEAFRTLTKKGKSNIKRKAVREFMDVVFLQRLLVFINTLCKRDQCEELMCLGHQPY